jgi:hypothetical protein
LCIFTSTGRQDRAVIRLGKSTLRSTDRSWSPMLSSLGQRRSIYTQNMIDFQEWQSLQSLPPGLIPGVTMDLDR